MVRIAGAARCRGKRRPTAHATAPGTVPVAGDDHAIQTAPAAPAIITTTDLKARIGTSSLAFRGYDVQNLGRTPELLAHPVYGSTVRRYLDLASAVAADTLHRPFDLAAPVERHEETTLEAFAEDVALIVSMELAQLALLEEFFGIRAQARNRPSATASANWRRSSVAACSRWKNSYRFRSPAPTTAPRASPPRRRWASSSRGPAVLLKDVQDLCTEVSAEGNGMVGVSSYIAPNTILVIGQGDTLSRLEKALPKRLPGKTMLRRSLIRFRPCTRRSCGSGTFRTARRSRCTRFTATAPRRRPRSSRASPARQTTTPGTSATP